MTLRPGLAGAAILVAGGALGTPGAVAAPSNGTLTLRIASLPHHPSELVLASRLEGSRHDGGRVVAFFVVSTEFGRHALKIGTARTAADGTARIRYRPTWSGDQRFVARVTGAGAPVPAATASYHVIVSAPGPLAAGANPARPLAAVGSVFLDAALTVVGAVWLVLIGMLVAAFAWMPRLAGRGTE
jgi:hypothetical protein